MQKLSSLVALSALTLAAVGCGAGAPELPPLEALVVEKPSTAAPAPAGNTAAQALCASDFDVTMLDAFIDDVNSGVEDQIELLRAIHAKQARRVDGDTWAWEVKKDQSTLTLTATEGEAGVHYEATFSHPLIGDYVFMDGDMADDGVQGGWSFYGLQGREIIEVDFTLDEAGFSVSRANHLTNVTADYSLAGTAFDITITAPRNTASAGWDTVSYDGYFQLNDDERVCFDYTAESGDFCAAECQ